MSASLLSAYWYRVSNLRPRLRAHVRVQRQEYRGQIWYVLSDTASGRQHRLNQAAYQIIGRCDGSRSLQEVWNAVLDDSPENMPSQDNVLDLLQRLATAELLQGAQVPHTDRVLEAAARTRARRQRMMFNPFAFQLPLGDPNAWLTRADAIGRLLFRPLVFWLWCVAMLAIGALAVSELPGLRSHFATRFLGTNSLWLMLAVYPVMKLLHELGHALAVRRWGGEVREIGIGLLFFVPAPYVDASAATTFPIRLQRAFVGAAGIVVELTLAAIGFVVWWTVEPGLIHNLGFAVAVTGIASSLLFNANPLLRFDAYHVICDLLSLPNLAQRSSAWWGHFAHRVIVGGGTELPVHAASERKWLWWYAPASLAYRIVLGIALVAWLGGQWVVLGALAAFYLILTVLVQPLYEWTTGALDLAAKNRTPLRARVRLAATAGAAFVLIFWVPLPLSTVSTGVVWLPDDAQLRPKVDGFVVDLPLRDGAVVQAGDMIARLENPELLSKREYLRSHLDGMQAERFQQLLRDPNAAQKTALELERLRSEIERVDEQIGNLAVRTEIAGTLALPRQADLPGSYVKQGAMLGYVLAPGLLRVRVAVANDDVQLVRDRDQGASVRLAERARASVLATRGLDVPAASRRVPSAALTEKGGGVLVNDPAGKDGQDTLEPVFLIDLSLPDHVLAHFGGRAWVRFSHGSEALAWQLQRRARQLFLKHFSPTN